MMKEYKRKKYIVAREVARRKDNELISSIVLETFDSLEELKDYLKNAENFKIIVDKNKKEELIHCINYYNEDGDLLNSYDVEKYREDLEKEHQEIYEVMKNNENYILDKYLYDLVEDDRAKLEDVSFNKQEIKTDTYQVEYDEDVEVFENWLDNLEATRDYITKLIDKDKEIKKIKVYQKIIKLNVNSLGIIKENPYYEELRLEDFL